MDYRKFVDDSFQKTAQVFQRLAESKELQAQIAQAAEWIVASYQKGGRLFLAGNGGSAADAQHVAAEMVGKLDKDRTSLPAFAMTVDSSLLTAVGNDYGYDHIFARQVQGLMEAKDIFVGITTSGNSRNIINALQVCRQKGIKSILLTGKTGGEIAKQGLADLVLIAPGDHTAAIQECHLVIEHALCFMTEKALIESGHIKYF